MTTCPHPGLEIHSSLVGAFPLCSCPMLSALGDFQNLPNMDSETLNPFVQYLYLCTHVDYFLRINSKK